MKSQLKDLLAKLTTWDRGSSGLSKYSIISRDRKAGTKTELTRKNIGLIGGGTGITPLYQILNAVYTFGDKVNVSLLFANKSSSDILLKEELDTRSKLDNISVEYVLDREEPGWTGSVGYINKQMIQEFMPPPGKDTMICHCGPRPMNIMVRKQLEELGYSADMLIKF